MTGVKSQGCWATAWTLLASLRRTPQEVMGGLSPRPKNDRAVSARIMWGTARVRLTMTWEEVEGSRCRHMIRHSLAPESRAAVAKSCSLSERTWPRTTRASPVQPKKERTTVTPK